MPQPPIIHTMCNFIFCLAWHPSWYRSTFFRSNVDYGFLINENQQLFIASFIVTTAKAFTSPKQILDQPKNITP
jgi:hypothetical protein